MTEDQQRHAGHWVFLWLMLAVTAWAVFGLLYYAVRYLV